MKTSPLMLIAASLCLFALPAAAFECTNSGAVSTAPNDNGFLDRTACGTGANASGAASTAVGGSATSSGFNSTAVGGLATSAGSFSTALGTFASSGGENSTALGLSASSAGNNSTAVGGAASSAGPDSTALGQSTSAGGRNSTALGYFAASAGVQSTAVGGAASSAGLQSTALGRSAASSGEISTALGAFASSGGFNSTALGVDASAPNDNTMVLGSIPGLGFGTTYVDIANGTTAPLAPLHIFRDDATQEMLILESDATGGPQDRAMMFLSNNGGTRFQFDNPALGTAWRFQAATGNQDNFEVTKVGTGEIEFRVDANGNAILAGLLFENSDRNAKTKIESIDPQEVLARVEQLPISEWEYKDTPGQRHVGPMAQDFREAFGLGVNDTSLATIDTSGIALASIKALAARNLELETVNQDMSTEIQKLQTRLAKLESVQHEVADLRALVVQLLPQVAQN